MLVFDGVTFFETYKIRLPSRPRHLCSLDFGYAGTVSWKQRYTSWPRTRPGLERVNWAGLVVLFPAAQFGLQLLALLTPVARATLEPQLLQCKFVMTHEPSWNSRSVDGRTR